MAKKTARTKHDIQRSIQAHSKAAAFKELVAEVLEELIEIEDIVAVECGNMSRALKGQGDPGFMHGLRGESKRLGVQVGRLRNAIALID